MFYFTLFKNDILHIQYSIFNTLSKPHSEVPIYSFKHIERYVCKSLVNVGFISEPGFSGDRSTPPI